MGNIYSIIINSGLLILLGILLIGGPKMLKKDIEELNKQRAAEENQAKSKSTPE